MKQFVILILFFIGSLNAFSQQEGSAILAKKGHPEMRNALVTINNLQFDFRVLNIYTEAELRSLPALKLKKIHFIHTSSYTIINKENACSDFNILDVNISKLEIYRDETKDVVIELGSTCKTRIKLISRQKLNEELSKLTI